MVGTSSLVPPPQLLLLAVRITLRRPGKNSHMMYATDVYTQLYVDVNKKSHVKVATS